MYVCMPCMCAVCVLYVLYVCCMCCMCAVCVLYVCCMCAVCVLYVLYVCCMCAVCVLYVCCMCAVCVYAMYVCHPIAVCVPKPQETSKSAQIVKIRENLQNTWKPWKPWKPLKQTVYYRPLYTTFHFANDRPSGGPILGFRCTTPHETVFFYPTFWGTLAFFGSGDQNAKKKAPKRNNCAQKKGLFSLFEIPRSRFSRVFTVFDDLRVLCCFRLFWRVFMPNRVFRVFADFFCVFMTRFWILDSDFGSAWPSTYLVSAG